MSGPMLSRRTAGTRLVLAALFGFGTAGCAIAGGEAEPDTGSPLSGTSWNKDQVRQLVVDEARAMGVDPALALAIAHAESYFEPHAESSKGARGVMQIMPATCRNEYGLDDAVLWDPQINVRIGIHFVRWLMDRYHGEARYALSYYNGGSRVGRWPNAKVLPATKPYVRRVMRLKERYEAKLEEGGFEQWRPLTVVASN